jgi:hypothetical protein
MNVERVCKPTWSIRIGFSHASIANGGCESFKDNCESQTDTNQSIRSTVLSKCICINLFVEKQSLKIILLNYFDI